MASSINASTSGAGGVITTADATGILQLQTAGVTAVTVNASSALGVGTSPSYGTSGQVLTSAGTGAAPTWSTISSGGMTLLGTLTTTSGTTQTLSSLTLTNYKYLQISVNNVGYSAGTTNSGLALNTYAFTRTDTSSANNGFYGILFLDLSSGAAFSGLSAAISSGNNAMVYQNSVTFGNLSAVNTSTTSLAFTFTNGNTFATGSIKVYGVA